MNKQLLYYRWLRKRRIQISQTQPGGNKCCSFSSPQKYFSVAGETLLVSFSCAGVSTHACAGLMGIENLPKVEEEGGGWGSGGGEGGVGWGGLRWLHTVNALALTG